MVCLADSTHPTDRVWQTLPIDQKALTIIKYEPSVV
jgi:hypothetical protein